MTGWETSRVVVRRMPARIPEHSDQRPEAILVVRDSFQGSDQPLGQRGVHWDLADPSHLGASAHGRAQRREDQLALLPEDAEDGAFGNASGLGNLAGGDARAM